MHQTQGGGVVWRGGGLTCAVHDSQHYKTTWPLDGKEEVMLNCRRGETLTPFLFWKVAAQR